ncbi:hydratase [Pikeienuella sp. HZG-20]|uniref:2-keto-4-pentenoate hydratase n=1 Tax=Paludibacillus litoralis TaxID=3133267 RepID=UPI0030EDBE6D
MSRLHLARAAAALAAVMLAAPAMAACPSPETMQAAASGWLQGARLPDPGLAGPEDAVCAYAEYRAALTEALGPPVGFKVGFTSKPAQEAFGVPGPVAGALFAPMLLRNGAEVSLADARTPFFEADLIVTVGDAAIMRATTREEAAAALDEVRPFVELPDLAFADGIKPTGALMTAYGVIPWRGVMGDGIRIADLPDPVANLGALTVDLISDGAIVGSGVGDMLLGHPLDVVLWLVRQDGVDLAPGMVISLGSLGKLHRASPNHQIEARYEVGGTPMLVAFTLAP